MSNVGFSTVFSVENIVLVVIMWTVNRDKFLCVF